MEQPLIVQAEYSFKGGNNDELCFKKGDLITVTQREEGGWWEGTLNDKTGWFPSNYVVEYKAPLPVAEAIRPPEEIQEYRSVVLKDLLDSERAHVAEIQGLLENFLEPLQQTKILTPDEYAQLMCNFVEVVKTHEELLTQMEECNDRVGKLFLTKAPHMKQVHQAYCAAHPKAIVILDKYKDDLEKYMERQGAATPGLLVLTTGLSKPFRRLDKYSAMLQELERHMESSHPDRGDTQRSVAVYKDIAATCSATRRQKELELQVLTGPVRGWQGQELSLLGDIIHMGSVAVGSDHRDRYFVLFPQTLLILSVSQRMSAFIYEGKLPLTGIIVNRLDDSDTYKNAFEINSPLIERIVAVCQGPNDANKWVELLTSSNHSMPIGIKRQLSNLSNSSIGGGSSHGQVSTPPAHSSSYNLDARGYCTRFSLCAYYNASDPTTHRITLPPSNYPPTAPYANLSDHFAKLVKAGQLKAIIVKMLLYPQSRQSIDMKCIPMRRKRAHRVSAKIVKDKDKRSSSSTSLDKSELERQDAFEFPTDSESDADDLNDEVGDCSSNPFDYIKFYANKQNSFQSTETFIDHGSGTSTPNNKRHCSSINLINLDSESLDSSSGCNSHHNKESLIIGSKAAHALARQSTAEQNVIIHTSKAHLALGIANADTDLCQSLTTNQNISKQTSENSELSSNYSRKLGGAYLACENLADLSDETKIKNFSAELPPSPTERHSMPTIFVGNRFNRSSKTEVYVPSWKDRNEMQNQSADLLDCPDNDDDEEIHSSSLDLPASCRLAPDQLQAELLYNFKDNRSENESIIAPPSIYNAAAIGERSERHSEICIEPKRDSVKSRSKSKSDSIKRCISYHYVPMAEEEDNNKKSKDLSEYHKDNDDDDADDKHRASRDSIDNMRFSNKCRCCENSQCPSPRSSDSGMAGSCTITSPDPPQAEFAYEAFYDENGELKLLPTTPSNRDDEATSTATTPRFDVCGTFREKFLSSEESKDCRKSQQQNEENCLQLSKERSSCYSGEFGMQRKSIFINCPSHLQNLSAAETSAEANANQPAEAAASGTENMESGMFRSGMYAHWWKKENLPTAVLKGIAKTYNKSITSPQTSNDSQCSGASSCFGSSSIGVSGFSEGNTYCSICQDCASLTSAIDNQLSADQADAVAVECPLCRISLSSAQLPESFNVHQTSSVECPFCSGKFLAQQDSLGSMSSEDYLKATAEGKHLRMSPPSNLSMLTQRMNQQQQLATATTNPTNMRESAATIITAPPAASTPSQHKRSLSFNHHLSYNQYTHTQPPPPHQHHQHQQQQPPSLPNHPAAVPNHKSNLAQTSNSISKNQALPAAAANMGTNARSGNTKANWSITNLRPAPPLRPTILNSNSSNASGGGGGSSNTLSSYCSGRKNQPTFEEDALVLRVFEAYCAAYQNTTRNTIHSALQPWTPCLPIRGGKLKTSKHFSTSNPQLPFLCNAGAPFGAANLANNQQNSTSSLNSSYIWREASPNNFNLYSSSISSLNATGYRYSTSAGSAGGVANAAAAAGAGAGAGVGRNGHSFSGINDYRAMSEERATRKSLNRLKSGFGSGYDNIFMTPLLPRKNKTSPKIVKNAYQQQGSRYSPPVQAMTNSKNASGEDSCSTSKYPNHPGLYDRRLNRSFETGPTHRYAGYGGSYMIGYGLKSTSLRRSTPLLAGGEDAIDSGDDGAGASDCQNLTHRGCVNGYGTTANGGGEADSQRHSGNWCCGLENEDMTPTLRQLWTAIRQLQQDMTQIKQVINDEVALRVNLQQLLMQHLETGSTTSSNTPKC